MYFDAPVVLTLAPVIGLAALLAAAWARRVRLRKAGAWSMDTAAKASREGRWSPLLVGAAAALATVALAGPRWGESTVLAETRALNLAIAVDISRSMLAEDAPPSRLGRAVRESRRLVQDLDGDRLGLIAFAGTSHILAPLTVDGGAILLYLDDLDPDVASGGGTDLGTVLRQGGELLRITSDFADRVLVVFTDGEGHDSLNNALREARRLRDLGVRLILVAEGGRTPARVPIRGGGGVLLGYLRAPDSTVVATARRDDVLQALADAAQGTVVAAELPDQAGAVRDLVAAFKRQRVSEARSSRGLPRGWIPLLLGGVLLFLQGTRRRYASLLVAVLGLGSAVDAGAQTGTDRYRRPPGDRAWAAGASRAAAAAYLAAAGRSTAGDGEWFNAGTAAMRVGDGRLARAALSRAAASLDPDVRYRALYNLGVLALAEAGRDTANREAHLRDAVRACREALLLRPGAAAAKWNLELALFRLGGRPTAPDQRGPPLGGPSASNPDQRSGGGERQQDEGGAGAGGGLTQAQAEQILSSIAEEERHTWRRRVSRLVRTDPPQRKNW